MPKTYTAKERASAIARAVTGLSKGIPLAVTCREKGMPTDTTIRAWADADGELANAIARAREDGFDQIAWDGMTIVDAIDEDPASRRVRSEYRLKLLAKWDPKRYGDKTLLGNDPANPFPVGFDVSLIAAPLKRLTDASEG